MEFIPVIDILGGAVVRGVGGRRELYRPVRSRLCEEAEAEAVVAAFLGVYPFARVYMADLDAIEHGRPNVDLVHRLLARFPELELWLDAGFASSAALAPYAGLARLRPVLGTESHADLAGLDALLAATGGEGVLSLDFRDGAFVGPRAAWSDAGRWPGRVIAMTMDAVGMGAGPATARLSEVIARAGERRVYAAGGLRDADDARALAAAG